MKKVIHKRKNHFRNETMLQGTQEQINTTNSAFRILKRREFLIKKLIYKKFFKESREINIGNKQRKYNMWTTVVPKVETQSKGAE